MALEMHAIAGDVLARCPYIDAPMAKMSFLSPASPAKYCEPIDWNHYFGAGDGTADNRPITSLTRRMDGSFATGAATCEREGQ